MTEKATTLEDVISAQRILFKKLDDISKDQKFCKEMLLVLGSEMVALPSDDYDPKVMMDCDKGINPWKGASYKGKKMSECPPGFLERYAETMLYFARNAEAKSETYKGKPAAPSKYRAARLARRFMILRRMQGWAEDEVRVDGQAAAAPPTKAFSGGGGSPFGGKKPAPPPAAAPAQDDNFDPADFEGEQGEEDLPL